MIFAANPALTVSDLPVEPKISFRKEPPAPTLAFDSDNDKNEDQNGPPKRDAKNLEIDPDEQRAMGVGLASNKKWTGNEGHAPKNSKYIMDGWRTYFPLP